MKVLVVDSDEVAGTATCRALGPGHQVRFAHSVQEAVRAIEESLPDAVVCEVSLSGERGDVLLSWLRAHHPAIRRIVFCANASPTSFDVDAAHEWVLKPDTPRVLWLLHAGSGGWETDWLP